MRFSEENGHILEKKTHKAGKIASIGGKLLHVYRVIILKQMVDHFMTHTAKSNAILSFLPNFGLSLCKEIEGPLT